MHHEYSHYYYYIIVTIIIIVITIIIITTIIIMIMITSSSSSGIRRGSGVSSGRCSDGNKVGGRSTRRIWRPVGIGSSHSGTHGQEGL